MAELKEWLTSSEVALHLGVTKKTVTNRCYQGDFPNAYKTEGKVRAWMIPREDMLAALAPPPGLTLEEAAEIVGVVPRTLGNACRNGKLEAVRHKNRWYISQEEAEAYAIRRKQTRDIDYDVLTDREAIWACYEANNYSYEEAAKACRCSRMTFWGYFHDAGHKFVRKAKVEGKKIALARGSGIPAVCPRSCPTYLDCLEEGSVCFFDPEQVPLDTEGEWTSVEFVKSTLREMNSRLRCQSTAVPTTSTREDAPRS